MTDNLKQKADSAWDVCHYWSESNHAKDALRLAVEATVAVALAEALAPVWEEQLLHVKALDGLTERVARLEADNSHDAPDPEWERRWDPKAAASTEEEAGPLFNFCKKCDAFRGPDVTVCNVCGSPISKLREPPKTEGTLQHNPGLGSVTMSTEQAAALLKSSKPAASTEEEIACTRHGQYRCPACAAGMVEEAQPPSPAESKGNGQWRVGRKLGRTLYIGDKCIGMVDTPELAAAIVEAMARGTEYVRADLLASAEAKLDHSQRKYRASCRHIEELAREDEEKRARLEAAERRIAELEKSRLDALSVGHATGREAGIREAAEVARAMRDADTGPSEYAQGARQGLQLAGRRILALLAKKPEVGT